MAIIVLSKKEKKIVEVIDKYLNESEKIKELNETLKNMSKEIERLNLRVDSLDKIIVNYEEQLSEIRDYDKEKADAIKEKNRIILEIMSGEEIGEDEQV